MKKRLIFNLSVSIILLLFLFFKVNLSDVIPLFSHINIYLLLFFPFLIILFFLRALKWHFLLKSVGVKISLLKNLKVLLIGLFYGMFTPAKIGELGRVYYLEEKKSKILPTVIWDKLSDILLLVFFCFLVLIFIFSSPIFYYLVFVALAGVLFFIFLMYNKKTILFVSRIFKINDDNKSAYLENMVNIVKNKKNFALHLLSGFLYYFLSFFAAYIAIISLKINVNFMVIFSLPIIILLGNAPITISGFGLREFVSIFFFQHFGESYSLGFSFSILWFMLMTLIPGIVGYFLSIGWKKNKGKK